MIHSPEVDSSRCLLIDWDNSSGPTVYTPTPFVCDTKHQDDLAPTSDNAGAGESTKKVAPLIARDSVKELANRTVG
jgi:hypothetical protein